ncbi:MAG: hypothetical protein ACLSFT_01985 [Ruminococcus callidus]
MKLKKKLAAAAVSGMMLATCLSSAAPVVQTSLSAAAADDNNDDWLHAEGSKLYDANGNQVWLTGANWFGFNCTEHCAHGLYATDIDAFLKTVGDHGINQFVCRSPRNFWFRGCVAHRILSAPLMPAMSRRPIRWARTALSPRLVLMSTPTRTLSRKTARR